MASVALNMRWAAWAAGTLLLSCGGASPTEASHSAPLPSPIITAIGGLSSPTPSASSPAAPGLLPVGIFVKDFLTEGGATYTVSLVSLDGRVVASATGAKRSHPDGILVQMPSISASNSRLYYLDGDSRVMYLRPDGTSGFATNIPLDSNSAAVFAVSPDDAWIAVAIITYPYPAKTRIYVEDLAGGGHHIDLFSSTTTIEWPVGWDKGHLVIGVGINTHPQNAFEGFVYADSGYHVADSSTGTRIATVCNGYEAIGNPVPAGTGCVKYPTYLISDWTGATRSMPTPSRGALSPDGEFIAECGVTANTVDLVASDGTTTSITTTGAPTSCPAPIGWIDVDHLVVLIPDSSSAVVDIRAQTTAQIQAQGFFAGSIPGEL